MAGLMNPKQAQPGNTAEQQGADSNVTPEEQKQYDEFVQNGMMMAYDENIMPDVMRSLEGNGNPVEGLGNTVAMIVMRLEDSAKESGVEISGDVMYHGAVELIEQLAELGEAGGINEFSEQDMESALYIALDVYRSTRQEQGTLPVEEIGQDMNELVAAEQAGTIDQMLPGVSEFAARQQGSGQPQRGREV